jgi:hypothetical protein
MQRRAAVAYIAVFLVFAAGAFGTLGAAQEPTVRVPDADYTLAQGDVITVDGRDYTVAEVSVSQSSGGGGTTYTAAFEWTDPDAEFSATWAAGEVDYNDTTYTLLIPNTTDPDSATLRAPLAEGTNTYEENGTTYVVQTDNDSRELVPLDEYQGVERRQLTEGQSITYDGNDATVANITTSEVRLEWTAEETTEVSAGNHEEITLNGQPYMTHFPSKNRVKLTTNPDTVRNQLDTIDTFHTRMNGLRGVIIISVIAAGFIAGLAFLPVKE